MLSFSCPFGPSALTVFRFLEPFLQLSWSVFCLKFAVCLSGHPAGLTPPGSPIYFLVAFLLAAFLSFLPCVRSFDRPVLTFLCAFLSHILSGFFRSFSFALIGVVGLKLLNWWWIFIEICVPFFGSIFFERGLSALFLLL